MTPGVWVLVIALVLGVVSIALREWDRGRSAAVASCCIGWHNGFGVECDDECRCMSCVEQREPV